jgi:hypothetical protein
VKGYPRRFLPALIATFIVLAVSGLLLVPTLLDVRFGWDVVWRLSGSQRLWVAGLHSAMALAICGFAGALWSVHMRVGWRSRRHLHSGLWTLGLLVGTALTALGILYFGDERWSLSASAVHTVLGIVSVIGGGVHWAVAIMERARRHAPNVITSRRRRLRPSFGPSRS